MFLSPTISNPQEYLEEALVFLKKYRWIYTTKNTRILCDRVLDNIPNEWIAYFATANHQNILDILSRGTNDSLRMFFDDLHQLKLNSEEFNKTEPPVFRYIGISDKKMHEIFLLAPVVDELCRKTNCDLVVDIGSGSVSLFFRYRFILD
ncbi:uncharacterized protein LOC115890679 [Sitophilus oryzae]|uniref:Uncharacterized protein LOC115890679 n=1 Tax=Sitophilus oryzae TaxID=7048 RepID=A0A6J2YU66_SITOR|nr:uncharacterized protein LOC115890679 [Sitophilus oryzae]